jgi:hypothetical protein
MPVTSTTLTELNELAKDYYTDVYLEQFNAETPFLNAIGSLQNAQFTGRKWIHGVKLQVGGGASNAGARSKLPDAQQGEYDQGEATVIRTYTRMALDGLAIEVTKKQQGSFRPALAEVMEDRLTAHDLECNRQAFSTGDGKLSLVSAAGANSATQTLQDDYGIAGAGNGTRHVYIGDHLAFRRVSSNTLVGRRTVTAVNVDTEQITLDSAINTTGGQCYVSKATSNDDNFNAGEAWGLAIAVSGNNLKGGSNFMGIPSAGRWRALTNGNNGTARPLTDTLLMTMFARVRSESRKTPDLAVTRPGVVLKYTELFLPLRRIDGLDEIIIGGFKPITAIQFAGGTIPVMEELDCQNGRLYLLHTASMKIATVIGTEWASLDGAQFDRISDEDGIEGYIRKYWNIFTVHRNANAVLRDLEDMEEIDRIGAAA